MPVLVSDQLNQLQSDFLEPEDAGVSYPSGLWTPTEVYAALNQRQNEFRRRTQIALSTAPLAPTIGVSSVALPNDWIATAEVIYDDGTTSRELPPADVWQSDRAQPTWQGTAGAPLVYSDADGPTQLELTLQPASSVASTLALLYVAICDPIDAAAVLAGIQFEVPDEAVPTVMWGVKADLLKKLGRAEDLARAAYADSRFEEGVLVWQLALAGVM